MKKKFVLTLALVLMVAVTLSAATPLTVSGTFKTGYAFKFASTNSFTQIEDGNEAEVATLVDFTGDFWKVSLATVGIFYDKEDAVAAKAELYLDKALAAQGMDMGDIALTLHVGNDVSGDAPSVLADKNDFRDDNVPALGINANGDNFGITLGYADMVKVYFSVDPTLKAVPMVIGATVTPIDGVSVGLGFTNAYIANDNNGLSVSAKADVAKLAGLDFDLAITGEMIMDLGNETTAFVADASTEIEGIGFWVAYYRSTTEVNALAAKVSYETEIDAFTVGASFKAEMDDLSDIENQSEYTIAANTSYVLGGAKYAVEAKYAISAETFTLTPTVSISF